MSTSIRNRNLYSGGPRNAQTDQAMTRAHGALKLASQTNDRPAFAEACRLMANALNADEQYRQSIEYYRKAIALFEGVGAGEQASRTRLGYMTSLYMMGKYGESLRVARTARQWFQASNQHLGVAKVYVNIGNLYMRREQHVTALRYHSKARALFGQLEEWHALAMTYLNLGNSLSFAGQLPEAEKMYDMCEDLSGPLRMEELFMQARYNKSYLMFIQGFCEKAIESFKMVKEYFTSTRSQHHLNLCDLDVAEIYLHLLRPVEAVNCAQRAAAAFSKASMRYERAKALAFCAMGLSQIDKLEEAETAALSSRTLFEEEGNKYWISMVDFCLAYVRMARGDLAEARLLAEQAKLQVQAMDLKAGMVNSLNRLGSLALESSQIKTAAACMTEVLKLTINKRR